MGAQWLGYEGNVRHYRSHPYQDARIIQKSAMIYKSEKGEYPKSLEDLFYEEFLTYELPETYSLARTRNGFVVTWTDGWKYIEIERNKDKMYPPFEQELCASFVVGTIQHRSVKSNIRH